MIVGFDLDGVLQPDIRRSVDFNLSEVDNVRRLMRPLYKPLGKWGIITARRIEDKDKVAEWVSNSFDVQPMFILQSCELSDSSSSYKARMLDLHTKVTLYIESDPVLAAEIKTKMTRTGCEVISLDSLFHRIIQQNGC